MNLRTHNSPSLKSRTKSNSPKNSVNGTALLEDNFLNKTESENHTLFKSSYLDSAYTQAMSQPKVTKKQKAMILSFFEMFRDLTEQIHPDLSIIQCAKSKDDEICIYRKSLDGISMIAVDEDGDGFYNFTGYKNGLETVFFENANPDIESITYKFFSK